MTILQQIEKELGTINTNGWYMVTDFNIKVTYLNQKGLIHTFNVSGIDENGDVLMSLTSEKKPNESDKNYFNGERKITVDKKWFTDEPKRIVSRIYPTKKAMFP